MKYLAQRLGFYLLAAWFSLTLNFCLPRLMPGDPAAAIFGRFRGQLAPEAIDALRVSFGLTDEPIYMQYLKYLGHVLRGVRDIDSVFSCISEQRCIHRPWTAFLAVQLLLSVLLGERHLGFWLNRVVSWTGFCHPVLLYCCLSLFLVGDGSPYVFAQLGWFPTRHAYSAGLTPE